MKILVYLAVWQRPEITEICFMGLSRLRKNSRLPIECFAVISEESMIGLCEEYDIKWTFYKNEPLGEKKNHGLTEAMKLDFDYLIETGSDDLIKDELIELYRPLMNKGVPMFGTKDNVHLNSETGASYRLISDTPYGNGRCISKKVLEQFCHGVDVVAKEPIFAPGRSVNIGKTGFFRVEVAKELEGLNRVEIIGQPRYRLWKDSIERGLDNNSNFFLMTQGVDHITVATNKPLTIDIKSQVNLWPFNPKLGEPYPLKDILEGLSQHEQSAIASLLKKNSRVVEYAV